MGHKSRTIPNEDRRKAKRERVSKNDRAQRLNLELKGGLEDGKTYTRANAIDIKDVPQEAFRQQEEESWPERMKNAFQTRCFDYLTEEASDYYFSRDAGRGPYYYYLRLDFVMRLSMAFRRKLTLGDMELLVANDSGTNQVVCAHKFQMKVKSEIDKINADRARHRQAPIAPSQFKVSDDLVTSCKFTPVRWIALPNDRFEQSRFFNKAAEYGDVLRLLASTRTWRYLGSYFDRVDPKDRTKKKSLPASGALWHFNEKTGNYNQFPNSSLVVMFKMNPARVEAHASIGAEYIEKLFREHLMAMNQKDTRDTAAEVAEGLWNGDGLDLYDQVLGNTSAA